MQALAESTIAMDKGKAREAFLDYRRAVRARHSAEDEQIMRAYRELAKGTQLIKLPDVIRAGGTTTFTVRWRRFSDREIVTSEVTVPRLAVARAHRTACWTFGVDDEGEVELRGKRDI